jgi:hypothetical protein
VAANTLYRDRVCGIDISKAGLVATIRVPSDKDPARRGRDRYDHLNWPRWSVLLHESWPHLGGDLAAWRGQRVVANSGIWPIFRNRGQVPTHLTKLMRAQYRLAVRQIAIS